MAPDVGEKPARALQLESPDVALLELLRATTFDAAANAARELVIAWTQADTVELFSLPLPSESTVVDIVSWRLASQAVAEGQQAVELASQPRNDTASMHNAT